MVSIFDPLLSEGAFELPEKGNPDELPLKKLYTTTSELCYDPKNRFGDSGFNKEYISLLEILRQQCKKNVINMKLLAHKFCKKVPISNDKFTYVLLDEFEELEKNQFDKKDNRALLKEALLDLLDAINLDLRKEQEKLVHPQSRLVKEKTREVLINYLINFFLKKKILSNTPDRNDNVSNLDEILAINKKNLEIILYFLIYIIKSLDVKRYYLIEILDNIDMCLTGLYNRLENIKERLLSQQTICHWLHELRKNLLKEYSSILRPGDNIHYNNAISRIASSKFSFAVNYALGDVYAEGQFPDDDIYGLRIFLSSRYNPKQIVSYLCDCIQFLIDEELRLLIAERADEEFQIASQSVMETDQHPKYKNIVQILSEIGLGINDYFEFNYDDQWQNLNLKPKENILTILKPAIIGSMFKRNVFLGTLDYGDVWIAYAKNEVIEVKFSKAHFYDQRSLSYTRQLYFHGPSDKKGYTPTILHWSCYFNEFNFTKLLLENNHAGFCLYIQDVKGNTPLNYACEKASFNLLNLLFLKILPSAFSIINFEGKTVLHSCFEREDKNSIEGILLILLNYIESKLEQLSEILFKINYKQLSVLNLAREYKITSVIAKVQDLKEKSLAAVSLRQFGETGRIKAKARSFFMQGELQQGVNALNVSGVTIHHFKLPRRNVLKQFFQGSSKLPLQNECVNNDYEGVRKFLAEINNPIVLTLIDAKNRTIHHFAARHSFAEIFSLLLVEETFPEAVLQNLMVQEDETGNTPLHILLSRKDCKVAKTNINNLLEFLEHQERFGSFHDINKFILLCNKNNKNHIDLAKENGFYDECDWLIKLVSHFRDMLKIRMSNWRKNAQARENLQEMFSSKLGSWIEFYTLLSQQHFRHPFVIKSKTNPKGMKAPIMPPLHESCFYKFSKQVKDILSKDQLAGKNINLKIEFDPYGYVNSLDLVCIPLIIKEYGEAKTIYGRHELKTEGFNISTETRAARIAFLKKEQEEAFEIIKLLLPVIKKFNDDNPTTPVDYNRDTILNAIKFLSVTAIKFLLYNFKRINFLMFDKMVETALQFSGKDVLTFLLYYLGTVFKFFPDLTDSMIDTLRWRVLNKEKISHADRIKILVALLFFSYPKGRKSIFSERENFTWQFRILSDFVISLWGYHDANMEDTLSEINDDEFLYMLSCVYIHIQFEIGLPTLIRNCKRHNILAKIIERVSKDKRSFFSDSSNDIKRKFVGQYIIRIKELAEIELIPKENLKIKVMEARGIFNNKFGFTRNVYQAEFNELMTFIQRFYDAQQFAIVRQQLAQSVQTHASSGLMILT